MTRTWYVKEEVRY